MGSNRRSSVDERAALALGVASGVLCALSGARPTGTAWIDVALLFVGGLIVAYSAASAHWWVLTVASIIATVSTVNVTAVLLALAALGSAAYIRVRQRELPEVRALAGLLIVNSLARSDLGLFLGLSAIVALSTGVLVVATSVGGRPRRVRRVVRLTAVGVGGFMLLALMGFLTGALAARGPLTDGNRMARAGLSELSRGDFDAAARSFEASSQAFEESREQLRKPWSRLALGLPVIAQHYSAAAELSAEAAEVSDRVVSAVRTVAVESLTVTDGQVDLDAIAELEVPFQDLEDAVGSLDDTMASVDSQWLLPAVRDRFRDFESDLDANSQHLDNAATAVALAPRMLGGEVDRHYLVLFTTPAEARGVAGFAGNFAVLRASEGQLRMIRFGRISELNSAWLGNRGGTITGPDGFLKRYGRFVLDGRRPAVYTWSNITMSPDFPTTAEVVSELFPQSGGREIDGVISLDPFVVQALLAYSGPVQVPGSDFVLTAQNAATFLLTDQYRIEDNNARLEVLDSATGEVMDRLLSGSLPSPVVLAQDLGPLASENRLMMWTRDAREQSLLTRVGLIGAFPTFDGGDGVGVNVTNVGESKIDTYLQRRLSYQTFDETETGLRRSTLTLTLTNTAPSSGLPNYIIGNGLGLPPGTSVIRLCIHTPLAIDQATVEGDDTAKGFTAGVEMGSNVLCRQTQIGSGKTVTVTMGLVGQLSNRTGEPRIWVQPLVEEMDVELSHSHDPGP